MRYKVMPSIFIHRMINYSTVIRFESFFERCNVHVKGLLSSLLTLFKKLMLSEYKSQELKLMMHQEFEGRRGLHKTTK
jgi:hypothetical protein